MIIVMPLVRIMIIFGMGLELELKLGRVATDVLVWTACNLSSYR